MESRFSLCMWVLLVSLVSGANILKEGSGIQKMKTQLNIMQRQVDGLQEVNQQLHMELNAVKAQNMDLVTHLNSVNSRSKELSNQLSRNAVLGIRNQLNNMQGQMDDLQEENYLLRMEFNAVKAQNLDLVTQMNSTNENLSHELDTVNAQNVKLHNDSGSFKAQYMQMSNEIDLLRGQNLALSNDFDSIKAQLNHEIGKMDRQNYLVSERLDSLEAHISEPVVDQFKSGQYADGVSFSAYSEYGEEYAYNAILIFDGIISNNGNAYDPLTGIFVCPSTAYYMFYVNVRSSDPFYMHAALFLGTEEILKVHSHDYDGAEYSSNLAVILCEANQQVKVHCISNASFLYGSRTSSFSGMLLYLANPQQ